MKSNFNEKLIAFLTLFSGLALSVVAEYYSIAGLTAIFSAAVIPTIIMGITLGLGKIVGTVWVKQNWEIAPLPIKAYLCSAIALLMLITSMGTFGYLSKAHSDQSLISGDVQSKIVVYDEKIKTEKENIEANRKALKQLDEGVDQVLGRSTSEAGADKAVSLRRSQQKERSRLQAEISQSQKSIAELNDARAPIAAEVRKVEAEVGPIKYIAAFVYGSTDEAILERAVTWVILLIIFVFDPLALILLISSQISFQRIKITEGDSPQGPDDVVESQPTVTESAYEPDDAPLTDEQVAHLKSTVAQFVPQGATVTKAELFPEYQFGDEVHEDVVVQEKSILEQHPYLKTPFSHFTDAKPLVARINEPVVEPEFVPKPPVVITKTPESMVVKTTIFPRPVSDTYIQNEEQAQSNLWAKTTGKE